MESQNKKSQKTRFSNNSPAKDNKTTKITAAVMSTGLLPTPGVMTINPPNVFETFGKNSEVAASSSSQVPSQGTQNNEFPGFVKLRTSEKKRFKMALAKGFSRDKALAVAQYKRLARNSKRVMMGLEPEPLIRIKKPRRNIVKMGIVPLDIYTRPFNQQAMAALQEAVIDAAIETGSDIKPEFEGCFPCRGWLMVICFNKPTAAWLEANAGAIGQRSGLDIHVIQEAQFPRFFFAVGSFPNSQGLLNEKILGTIEAQNKLQASSWKVVQRKCCEGNALELSIEVDPKSMQTLKEYRGRIAYRFGHIVLQLKESTGEEFEVHDTDMRTQESFQIAAPFTDEVPSTSRQAKYFESNVPGYPNKEQTGPETPFGTTSVLIQSQISYPNAVMQQPLMPFTSAAAASWRNDSHSSYRNPVGPLSLKTSTEWRNTRPNESQSSSDYFSTLPAPPPPPFLTAPSASLVPPPPAPTPFTRRTQYSHRNPSPENTSSRR